jgi:hypothetical protein
MSLEKSIEKLTNAITAAKMTPSVNVDPSMKPIGLPEIKVVCKTEWAYNDPNDRLSGTGTCVCRDSAGRVQGTIEGVCPIEGLRTTLPMKPVSQ